MAGSLGFHIIFAAIGMTMPVLMATAHYFSLRRKDADYAALTDMWMKGVAILFAVGAVSGTVLSFELGLLWPGFMRHAGPIIGMPFSWEGTAFFLEAVAIGLFLYGKDRMQPWLHWATGVLVAISGTLSGVFVVAANSWMNTPSGFSVVDGQVTNIDPVQAMFNPSWLHQSIHMQLAALQSVGFAVAGVHALLLLQRRSVALNSKAVRISMGIAAVASLLQPMAGHFSAQRVAHLQPAKLAAMESHFDTGKNVSLWLGGVPDVEKQQVRYGIAIPGALSFLAFNDTQAQVRGLNDFAPEDRPPVVVPHIAFQIMVAVGSALAGVSVLWGWCLWRQTMPRAMLYLLAACTPLGFVAMEAGWVVTEVGRQPWIIHGFMRTRDALTPMPGLVYHFALFALVYTLLGLTTVWSLWRHIRAAQLEAPPCSH